MGHKQGGEVNLLHDLQIPVMNCAFGQHVQGRERFIQQSHFLGKKIGAQKSRSLFHAAGQLGRIFFLGAVKAKLVKVSGDFLPGFSFFHPLD